MGRRQGSLAAVVATLVMALALVAGPVAAAAPLSLGDILRLLEAGVGPEVIVSQGSLTGFPAPPTVDEILRLREAGASDDLIRALQEAARPSESPPAGDGLRIYRTLGEDGREVMVLTNLDENGRRLGTPAPVPLRGVISTSERGPSSRQGVHPAAARDGEGPSAAAPAASLIPGSIEVTVRNETDDAGGRLEELEGRLARLESDETPSRPPVGANFPRHPINDHRDYPIVTFPFLPVLTPFAFEAQEFRVRNFGPFTSFTGARAAGVDPFRAPGPCSPGQACSIEQRLAGP